MPGLDDLIEGGVDNPLSARNLLWAAVVVLMLVLLGVIVFGTSLHFSASNKGVHARSCTHWGIQAPTQWAGGALAASEGLTKIGRGQSGEDKVMRSEGVINYSKPPMTGSMWDTPAQMSLGDEMSTQHSYFGSKVLGLDLSGHLADIE